MNFSFCCCCRNACATFKLIIPFLFCYNLPRLVILKKTLSFLNGSVGIFFCVLWPVQDLEGAALSGRRMLLRMQTMRRRRKCCIYAVHGLLSSVTGENKPCWQSWLPGLISLTAETVFSKAPSVPPVVVTLCLKAEPLLCSHPEDPDMYLPTPKKCLRIESEWEWWRYRLSRREEHLKRQ